MNCRKCRVGIPEGSNYCPRCGAKQNIAPHRKTRGNGQGTAFKRGKTWTAMWTEEIYLDPKELKIHQVQRSKGGFKTKTAALAYASSPPKKNERQNVTPTLRYYWDVWRKGDYLDLSRSKRTAYDIAWKRLSELAPRRMDEITIQELQDCIDGNTDTYYPARDMKTLLSHLYKRAVAEGNARTNLSVFVRLPPLNEQELTPFNELELHKLWQAYAAGQDFIAYLLLMIYTGMMPGELFKFKADMIDWEKHEIRGCGLKTKKRKEAPIVFPDMIVPVLTDLVEKSTGKDRCILRMNRDNFYKTYHVELQKVGVRDLPPYSCRHTTATALALGNIAPSVIQEVMRHTKFSTTQRYIHPDSSDAVAAVNTMGK